MAAAAPVGNGEISNSLKDISISDIEDIE